MAATQATIKRGADVRAVVAFANDHGITYRPPSGSQSDHQFINPTDPTDRITFSAGRSDTAWCVAQWLNRVVSGQRGWPLADERAAGLLPSGEANAGDDATTEAPEAASDEPGITVREPGESPVEAKLAKLRNTVKDADSVADRISEAEAEVVEAKALVAEARDELRAAIDDEFGELDGPDNPGQTTP
jgi:hypothetical protein